MKTAQPMLGSLTLTRLMVLLTTLLVLLLATACQQQESTTSSASTAAESTDVLPLSQVLAVVNGEDITQNDVEFMIERTFSSVDRLFDGEQLREKVLQSLIAAKAMQQSIQQDFSAEEQFAIQQKIQAYSEELYVKAYLSKHATPQPVSTAMVTEYYAKNPEQFGGGQLKSIEILKASNKVNEAEREQLLVALPVIKQTSDWQQYAQSSEIALIHLRSKVQANLLEPAIEIAAKKLIKNEVSDVIFIDSVPHIIRVSKVETLAAQPLSAVSASIRKKLAALQLKQAVKKASEQAMTSAKVERK